MEKDDDPALIDEFIRRHYSFPGVLRLHRYALGWDLLRAPGNILLAPAALVARVLSFTAYLARLRRLGRFAGSIRPQFRTDVGSALEADLMAEVISRREPRGDAHGAETTRQILRDYIAVRSAVSEIGAALVLLAVGLIVFHSVTPGVISLAPVVTERATHARDVASFPLGPWLGGAWYGVFPGALPLGRTVLVGVCLAVALSLATTFSGVLSDPLQVRLGIHRRRLRRLLRRVDRADHHRPSIEGEFVLARGADLVDLATMLIRFLRP